MMQPPLPTTSKYWMDVTDRQTAVTALFDRSAEHYDRACTIMSLGSGQTYRRAALQRAGVRPGMTVLDVGTGTGLLAREIVYLLGSSGGVIGVDPSMAMMTTGRHRVNVTFVQGVGELLPFADGQFDFITMGYALRHVPDLDQTFEEYVRVLKPEGRVLLLEITRPASSVGAVLSRLYFGSLVPFFARVGTRSTDAAALMRFYWETIANCVAPEIVLASLTRSGFAATRTVSCGIFTEYTGIARKSLSQHLTNRTRST